MANCSQALVLGDGDGRFTARLLRANSQIRVHAVDASHDMLAALTKACIPNASRLTTEHADLRTCLPRPATASPTPRYDLVVTHFFLDCLSTGEVLRLAQEIKTVVSPDALWVVSEFAVPAAWFPSLIAGLVVHLLYVAFGILTGLQTRTLPNYASGLGAAGFTRLERHPCLGGFLVCELWKVAGPPPMQPAQ